MLRMKVLVRALGLEALEELEKRTELGLGVLSVLTVENLRRVPGRWRGRRVRVGQPGQERGRVIQAKGDTSP